ncbi:MAG: ATP-binding cassette domain-containing protein, partial [Campylobacteraceae bacterium]|nr:ATP-binding cassette domain-containing protein [Campylobacteraceae bacterium]
MIEIKNLSKKYVRTDGSVVEVLKNISLTVPDRSITAVVGPSGAGKSTLSKLISLLERPSEGSILVNGKDLSHLWGEKLRTERRAIGTIFQSSALLHRKTAAQNIALPLEYLGVVKSDIEKRVKELLEAVGLSDRGDYYPSQLSGGQQQRVGIARALALHPQVLLSDEATSGLDPQSTQTILRLLKKLRDEFDLSIILITHEMDVVRNIADSIAAIKDGEIVEQGSVQELVSNPNSEIGRQLISLRVAEAFNNRHLVAELTYSINVPSNWSQILSRQLNVNVHLLGANIEQ